MGRATHFGMWPSAPKDRVRPAWPKGAGRGGPKETTHRAIMLAHLTL